MKLTSLDIRKQEFTRGFRGYEPDEVNAFLQMVSNQWDEILDESRRKDERIRALESKMEHYEKVEEALQEALQTARDTSRKAVQNAEDKARLIVDEAERRAEDIKRDAEQDRHQIKRETAKLSGRRSEIISRLRAFLMSEMELLARFEGDDPVGFIKLLPAEERRVQELPTERGEPAQVPRHDPARGAEGEARTASTSASMEGEGTSSQHTARGEPAAEHSAADEHHEANPDEDTEGGSSEGEVHAARESGADEDEQRAGEEVIRGPGWTARTVISNPSEQSSPRPEAEYESEYESEGEPGGEEAEEETTTKSSSDEIDKIRRILSDLD